MRKLTKLALGLALAGAMAVPAFAEDGVTATEIVLGTHTDLSGPAAIWGVGAVEGARMRYDEINEKGGINGRKIKYIVEDTQYQVPRAVQLCLAGADGDAEHPRVAGDAGVPQDAG